jgi:predicted  nucleic acid-binding Zn-ribbon protein
LAVRRNSQDILDLRESVDTLRGRVDVLTQRVDDLTQRMEHVETKLDTKADNAVVREIDHRVSTIERRPPAEA